MWNPCIAYRLVLSLLCLQIPLLVYGQKQRILSLVKDDFRMPIPDVMVNIDSLNMASSTDKHGYFHLTLYPGRTYSIVLKHIAFETKEILYRTFDNTPLEIIMQSRNFSLEDSLVPARTTGTVSFLFKSIENSRKHIAGSTSISVMSPATQRRETLKDALRFTAGVTAQKKMKRA